jgi:N-methylhydantoinase B/oxoprolinase/acetone carboxylase alpha subunit
MIMPGGAGFGKPEDRERQRVLDDLSLGYITLDGARDDYGIQLEIAADES